MQSPPATNRRSTCRPAPSRQLRDWGRTARTGGGSSTPPWSAAGCARSACPRPPAHGRSPVLRHAPSARRSSRSRRHR
ncbi:hypothetical protein G6F68_020389 [Rhizopus microsporus]|nr:hypothetical protein G6F68_020389 [Rhizopus microsporus]